jgi:hypothetical protein
MPSIALEPSRYLNFSFDQCNIRINEGDMVVHQFGEEFLSIIFEIEPTTFLKVFKFLGDLEFSVVHTFGDSSIFAFCIGNYAPEFWWDFQPKHISYWIDEKEFSHQTFWAWDKFYHEIRIPAKLSSIARTRTLLTDLTDRLYFPEIDVSLL